MQKLLKVKNRFGEELDTLVEGKENADTTIVFVHGFGTNKHENKGLFDDLSNALRKDYRIVRFDFSGYGKSEGKQENWDYKRGAEDLGAIFDWVKGEYEGTIYILAVSMGCFVTSLLESRGIDRAVLLSIPNANISYLTEYFQNRIKVKGGNLNTQGISVYPRGSGEIQKVGKNFWKVLKEFKPVKSVSEFAVKTKLLIIHPLQDEIVGNKYLDEYKTIPNVKFIEIDGNHTFTKNEDREKMIEKVTRFFAGG